MNILLTGCTGFIGQHISNHLLEKKHKLFCISSSEACHNKGRVNHLKHNLASPLNYNNLPEAIDCIIHAAAINNKELSNIDHFRINTFSTLNLLEYARQIGVKRFIYISSIAVTGYRNKQITELSHPSPVDFYGMTKYQSELLVNQYSSNFSTVILRLSFPYGPGQINGIVPKIYNNIIHNKPITIYQNNCPVITPVYIDDVIEVIDKSLELNGNFLFNISGDEGISIHQLALKIGHLMGRKPNIRFQKDSSIKNLNISNTRIKKYLPGWPEISLNMGLERFLSLTSDKA